MPTMWNLWMENADFIYTVRAWNILHIEGFKKAQFQRGGPEAYTICN